MSRQAWDDGEERIAELRGQIASGSYQPDPLLVASAIIRRWTGEDLVEAFEACSNCCQELVVTPDPVSDASSR